MLKSQQALNILYITLHSVETLVILATFSVFCLRTK